MPSLAPWPMPFTPESESPGHAPVDPSAAAPRPKAAYWIVSLALAAVFLYFSLRGIQWPQVWASLRTARPGVVLLACGFISTALFLRAARWRVLLSARTAVPLPSAFWATSAGYLGNNILPARAGEVVRTMLISRETGLSRTFVLTTALAERVVDAIALVTISATILLVIPVEAGWISRAGRPFALLGLCGVLAIALLPVFEKFWFRVLAKLPVPQKLRGIAEHVLTHVLDGIRSFHDRGRLARFLGFTTVIWLLDGFTAVTCGRAIGLDISLPVALLLIAALGLSSALPSTPGYVGIFQFVAANILPPFGVSKNDAIAYIILFQAAGYLVILLWGLLAMTQRRQAAAIAVPAPEV